MFSSVSVFSIEWPRRGVVSPFSRKKGFQRDRRGSASFLSGLGW